MTDVASIRAHAQAILDLLADVPNAPSASITYSDPRADGSCRCSALDDLVAKYGGMWRGAQRVFVKQAIDVFHFADHALDNVLTNTGAAGQRGGESYDWKPVRNPDGSVHNTGSAITDVISVPDSCDTDDQIRAYLAGVFANAVGPALDNPAGAGF